MSRLDSFIRRMSAQRDLLNALPERLVGVPGWILEFGLGSGRTYDHLRGLFPERRIIVFELAPSDSPLSRPPPEDLVIGDLRETAAAFPDGVAALVHADIEAGVAAIDAGLADWLPALMARLLVPGGYAINGAALSDPRLDLQPLPPHIAEGRYYWARRL